MFAGAKNGTRTRDPDLGKVVLYQLSYFRVKVCALANCSAGLFPFCEYKITAFFRTDQIF